MCAYFYLKLEFVYFVPEGPEEDIPTQEGVISPLSSTGGAPVSTPSHCRSQHSTVDKPPDCLTLLATYGTTHNIHQPTLLGSTQHVFHTNTD